VWVTSWAVGEGAGGEIEPAEVEVDRMAEPFTVAHLALGPGAGLPSRFRVEDLAALAELVGRSG
jgi:hypothetical protein